MICVVFVFFVSVDFFKIFLSATLREISGIKWDIVCNYFDESKEGIIQ